MGSCSLQLCFGGEKKRILVAMDKVGGDESGDKVAGCSKERGSGWEGVKWASLKRIAQRRGENLGRIVFSEGG